MSAASFPSRRHWPELALTLAMTAVWLLLMVSHSADEIVEILVRGNDIPMLRIGQQIVVRTLIWIALTPPLIWLVRLLDLPAGPRLRHVWQLAAVVLGIGVVRTILGTVTGALIAGRAVTWEPIARSVLLTTHAHTLVTAIGTAAILLYDFGRAARDRERLRAELAAAQLQQLRSRLQPHFLFNALNSIATLVHRDPHTADRMVTSLSGLLRSSLDLDERQEVLLPVELQFVREYLDIQQVRFEERLAVAFDVDDDTLDCAVPSLVLQPLVENAIVHGIGKQRDGGRLVVAARWEPDGLLVLEIRDSGAGDSSNVVHGVGLANVAGRLAALYGNAATLTFRREAEWFVAAVRIPARKLSR